MLPRLFAAWPAGFPPMKTNRINTIKTRASEVPIGYADERHRCERTHLRRRRRHDGACGEGAGPSRRLADRGRGAGSAADGRRADGFVAERRRAPCDPAGEQQGAGAEHSGGGKRRGAGAGLSGAARHQRAVTQRQARRERRGGQGHSARHPGNRRRRAVQRHRAVGVR